MHNGNPCNTYNIIKKARKPRKVFSQFAQRELETEFQRSPYLTAWKRQQLAQKLNLTERQVRVWFQNRRMRNKNDEKNRKKSPSTKKTPAQKTDLNTDKQSTPRESTNGYIEDFKNISQPVDEMKNIQAPMYNLLHHQNNYQKPNQFSDYNGTSEFANNQIDPINNSTPINNEEMWTYPKYSSYEALLNDHQDTILGGYNFNNNNVGLTATNRNGTELSHFTSLQNLVYQYE